MKNLQLSLPLLFLMFFLNSYSFSQTTKASFSFSDLKNGTVGREAADLKLIEKLDSFKDYQSIRLNKEIATTTNTHYQTNMDATKSKGTGGLAVGALVGGLVGLVVGAKIGISSAKGDGVAGIVTGPMKMGLGMGLGTLLGAGVGGALGKSISSKSKNQVQKEKLKSL